MPDKRDQWAYVSEYKDYNDKKNQGSNRRLFNLGPKASSRNTIFLAAIAILIVLIVLVTIFLWRGSWIIPFLQ